MTVAVARSLAKSKGRREWGALTKQNLHGEEMGEVIELPNGSQRTWRGVAEGYREILREDGYSEKSIKEIIDELAGYWGDLLADDSVDIHIPNELGLTQGQLAGVRQATEKGVIEFLERNRDRQYRANATMLWLIAWRVGK